MPRVRKPQTQNNNYYTYVDTFDSYNNEFKITRNDYSLICKTFFYVLSESLIKEAKNYYLPFKLGVIGIRKTPTFGRGYFDYQLYRKEGIKRYIQNTHSDSFVTVLKWDQSVNRFHDKLMHLFKLEPSRIFSRTLAKYVKDNNIIHTYYDK